MYVQLLAIFLCGLSVFCPTLSAEHASVSTKKRIGTIFIDGAHHVKEGVIRNKLPYKSGDVFDPHKSADAIHQLYNLGYFHNLQLEYEHVDEGTVNLYVILEENKLLEKFVFSGNTHVKEKKIREELNLHAVESISDEMLTMLKSGLTRIYKEEGYHHPTITTELKVNPTNPDKATAIVTINEGPFSYITHVTFRGNKTLPDRKLRGFLFSRERNILSFMNQSGSYDPAQLELDKRRLEMLYRDYGYLNARVMDVQTSFSKDKKAIALTFTIEEGNPYTVTKISVPGDDIFLESDLLPYVSLKTGFPYSHSKLAESIEQLKNRWSLKGYINADVYPQIVPDDVNQTVEITFLSERGSLMHVNRINITGNVTTRDKVIRREIPFEEGDLITSKKLQQSQDLIERLSFFERGGVNWKLHRLTDEIADLEMNVKEGKTGNFSFQLSYGSQEHSSERAWRGGINLSKLNLFGRGWQAGASAQLQFKRNGSQLFEGFFIDPHLFGRNISGSFAGFHRRQDFQEWCHVNRAPTIKESGGEISFGFSIPNLDRFFEVSFETGLEYINAKGPLEPSQPNCPPSDKRVPLLATGCDNCSLQKILDRGFQTGLYQWFGLHFSYDSRNHRVYPNRGSRIYWGNTIALPKLNKHYSYFKSDLEASYYTPLIGDDYLVFAIHGKAGIIFNLTDDLHIPYKELYHMGGQQTVRGFTFGSIGPAWQTVENDGTKKQSPLGARKALQLNAELIFPIIPDYSIKGHFFYDGGAGWDTPKKDIKCTSRIVRNKLNWRHSVGIGLNIVNPMPAKIDWGYKLDRDKKSGESPHEFHVQMNAAW